MANFDNILNLTPHQLTIWTPDDEVIARINSSGILRVRESHQVVGSMEGVPVIERSFDSQNIDLQHLLERNASDERYYYVSLLAGLTLKAAGANISRILIPGQEHRDPEGRIDGIVSFGVLAKD